MGCRSDVVGHSRPNIAGAPNAVAGAPNEARISPPASRVAVKNGSAARGPYRRKLDRPFSPIAEEAPRANAGGEWERRGRGL